MAISSTTRRPGVFIAFDILSAQQGLAAINRNIALIGAKTSAGSKAVESPYLVLSEADADAFFGIGSELALMCRAAIKASAAMGKGPAIYGVPVADAGGTAAIDKFTCTGSATVAGDIEFKIAGRTLRAGVAIGDSVTVMASAMKSAVDEMLSDLPITAGASVGVMSVTATQTGVNGKDLFFSVVSVPAGVTVVASATTAGSGLYDITNALNSLIDKHYHGIALANHTAVDKTDLATHITSMALPGTKKWTRTFMAETGTLSTGTTLSAAADSRYQTVVTCESFPNMTGEIAAMECAIEEGEEDVARSFDDVEIPLYLPPAASVYTDAEIETALAAGATPLGVTANGQNARIIKAVTTKTTESSNPFYVLADASVMRTLIEVGVQVDIRHTRDFKRAKKSARTIKQVKTSTLSVLYAMEVLEQLQNVDQHKDELLVVNDSVVVTRLNVNIPASVISPLHQLDETITLFLE